MEVSQADQLISVDECTHLAQMMEKKYALYLADRTFEVSTDLEAPGIKAKVILKNADHSFYYPVEARMLHVEEEFSVREGLLFLLDYIDLYFEEYLTEDENLLIPIDWTAHQYDAVDFEVRGQVLNLKLETMADELLGGNLHLS